MSASCLFFVPQTGELRETRPKSNYKAWRIPRDKEAFVRGWVDVAEIGPHGLQYPSGFIRTLPILDQMCERIPVARRARRAKRR